MITINWEAVSAIATSVACIIALWQTHIAYREKLKFKFHDNALVLREDAQLAVVKLDVNNIGNRVMEITGWGLLFRGEIEAVFSPPPLEWAVLGGFLPKTIEVGHSTSLYFAKDSFVATIKSQCEANNAIQKDKVKIIVYDGSGSRHVIKTSKRCKDFLEACNNPKGT